MRKKNKKKYSINYSSCRKTTIRYLFTLCKSYHKLQFLKNLDTTFFTQNFGI